MTTTQLVNYFSILQDKYGSPNLVNTEIVSYLNHATNEWLNRLVPDSQGGVVNFENDANITAQIKPLVYTFSVNSDSSGLLTESAINTALVSASEAGATYFRPMSMVVGTNVVKYVKHNDIGAYLRNSYKEPTTTYRLYTEIANGLQLYPQSSTTVSLTVMKKPRVLVYGSIDPELEDYVLYNVLMIALSLAGVSTRDGEMLDEIRALTTQGK